LRPAAREENALSSVCHGAMAGSLDIDASDKAARFVRFCNAFNIPLLTLVDVPGFLPGIEQEYRGIIRHEIDAAENKAERRRELIEQYRGTLANPYVSAARGFVDDIFEPAETRRYLANALEALHSKRELRPPKKHGLIPL
jgi:acetyl-CoA carboxylase carboxyltransferase component